MSKVCVFFLLLVPDTQEGPHHQKEKEENTKNNKRRQGALVVLGNTVESHLREITTIVPARPSLVNLELLHNMKDTGVIVETAT